MSPSRSSYATDIQEIIEQYQTSPDRGLSVSQVDALREEWGPNTLRQEHKIHPLQIFAQQFRSTIVAILIGAVIISVIIAMIDAHKAGDGLHLSHFVEAMVIFAIIILNALLGFVQEYRAEQSIEALKKLTSLRSTVMRGGEQVLIDAEEIVPGDILILAAGDKVPADARLIDASSLEIQEAALTGESVPVSKSIEYTDAQQLGDQHHRVFGGTVVTKGRGRAIVTQTGMQTQIGKIATMIHESDSEETPLQRQLARVGRQLGMMTIVICIVVFIVGILAKHEWTDFLLVSVGLAVAAIPEGLPAVVTISLALGVQRMIRHNVLIRKLHAVETLGCTSVICSDKTGTLTKNQMTVKKIYLANGDVIDVTGDGYSYDGEIAYNGAGSGLLQLVLRIGQLCNDATVSPDGDVTGDPTEAALVVSGIKGGIDADTRGEYERIDELPFDSDRKMMSTVHSVDGVQTIYTKGAPLRVLERCTHIRDGADGLTVRELTDADRAKIEEQYTAFASDALRVLGFAYGEHSGIADGEEGLEMTVREEQLVFVGLQAMIDPPRQSSIDAVAAAQEAGIRVIMITGDHMVTAQAIAAQIGIGDGAGEVKAMSGDELREHEDLSQVVQQYNIFARVDPADKMRLVTALQEHDHVVAMTGDGVNDAPALKKSDIGICVGSGTDVAKEASDMILTNDDFASIVTAVEEGRGIYDNIKKFVRYLLASNLGEIMTLFVAVMLAVEGMPLPLIAIQILWINLLTDGLPALALSLEPIDHDVMRRPPRSRHAHIIDRQNLIWMIGVAVVMSIGTLAMFYRVDTTIAQTVAFTTLMMFQMFNVLNCKSMDKSVFRLLGTNMRLWGAMAMSIIFQILVVQTPIGNTVFETVPLTLAQRGVIVLVSSSVLWLDELRKALLMMTRKK